MHFAAVSKKAFVAAVLLVVISIFVVDYSTEIYWRNDALALCNRTSKINSEKDSKNRLVIVTAFSDNHFEHGLQLVKNASGYFSSENQPLIIIYDLGLNSRNLYNICSEVGEKILLRQFEFEKYPKYVSDLIQYRWKPIIIRDCLAEFGDIWWLDASMRLCRDFRSQIEIARQLADSLNSPGIVLPTSTSHSIYSATHPDFFTQISFPEKEAKRLEMFGANVIYVHSKNSSAKIIAKWSDCALEKACMAPEGSTRICEFRKNRWTEYGNCHRFDQSALNVILARQSDFDTERYSYNLKRSIQTEGNSCPEFGG